MDCALTRTPYDTVFTVIDRKGEPPFDLVSYYSYRGELFVNCKASYALVNESSDRNDFEEGKEKIKTSVSSVQRDMLIKENWHNYNVCAQHTRTRTHPLQYSMYTKFEFFH